LAIIGQDLARDSRVASVLGPGTIAVSSLKGIHDQVAVIDTEYGQYAGDAAEADIIRSNHWDVSKLTTDQSNQLSQVQQAASTAAVQALAVQVIRATSAAEQARAQFDARKDPTAKVIDGRERTAQDAVDKIELPPLFAQFINTLDGARPDAGDAAARRLFDNFSAAYGVCDQNIARVLQAGSSCQTFIERFLLDLPNCPTAQQLQQSGAFCQPKVQWGAALPRAQRGQPAREVITVRLKPQAVGDGNAVRAVRDQINKDLANPSPKGAVRPFAPIQCRDRATRPTSQEPFTCVVAGAPLLAQGVV